MYFCFKEDLIVRSKAHNQSNFRLEASPMWTEPKGMQYQFAAVSQYTAAYCYVGSCVFVCLSTALPQACTVTSHDLSWYDLRYCKHEKSQQSYLFEVISYHGFKFLPYYLKFSLMWIRLIIMIYFVSIWNNFDFMLNG